MALPNDSQRRKVTGQKFDFVVEGLTTEQADALMMIILAFVESHKLMLGGGYLPYEENEDGEETGGV